MFCHTAIESAQADKEIAVMVQMEKEAAHAPRFRLAKTLKTNTNKPLSLSLSLSFFQHIDPRSRLAACPANNILVLLFAALHWATKGTWIEVHVQRDGC